MSYLIDCYGNKYDIIKMPATGLCGYHALSYSLAGNPWWSYKSVIDDCINVFTNIPDLYRLRTNFGSRRQSSLTVADYAAFMQNSVYRVQAGLGCDTDAYCEDAHLTALSLLYDIVICVYSQETKQWHVFNEAARRGYILLLNSPGHFDVLKGPVPPAAHTHAVSRHNFGASDEVWHILQRQYSFDFVAAFPEHFTGINVLNNPVVHVTEATVNNKVHVNVPKSVNKSFACEFPGCKYITANAKALAMHKMNAHENINKLHFCDFPGCTYKNSKRQRVLMHRTQKHFQQPVYTKSRENVNNGQSVCVTDVNHTQGVVNTEACKTIGRANDLPEKVDSDGFLAVASRKLQRKTVSLTAQLQTPSNIDNANIELFNRFSELPDDVDDQDKVSSGQATDADNDVNSLASVETKSSRKSKRLSNIYSASRVQSLSEAVQKEVYYTCDVCSSVFKKSRGLSVHKSKRHATNVRADDAMIVDVEPDDNVRSMESDAISMNKLESMNCGVRKSTRLINKNKTLNAVESTAHISLTGEPDMASATLHKGKFTNRIQTDIADNMNLDNPTKSSRRYKATHTVKCHSKTSFSEEIAELEKKILPRKKAMQQTDPLYDKLKAYHDSLLRSVSNTTTEKLSAEVLDVILNATVIDDTDRRFQWSKDDEIRLNELNETCKLIQPRTEWKWSAPDHTEQGQYNDKRMQICITKECEWKLVECESCGSTGLLVGDQINSEICHDCMKLNRVNVKEKAQKQDAWKKVKPKTKEFPKTADGKTDLPKLQPGDKAVIAPVHGVVTVTKNSYGDKRMRLESISLVQDPVPTWCKLLPRTSLADRFMIIERRVKTEMKYIVANADRVRQWLRYLFLNHSEFIRLRRQNQLAIDEAAIETLGPDLELAEVDSSLAVHTASEADQVEQRYRCEDDGLTDATAESGFSENHVFSFDRYDALYLQSKDVLRIRKEGKMEIVEDHTVRKPTYCTSANLAFPHLYPNGEMSPLDFGDYKLGRYLLKKQAQYAHRMSDGRLQWNFAEDDIHMAHQYSRLSEQTVRANVGYYIASHPSVTHVPLQSILTAFKDGVDQDSGLLDSHLPDLTTVMSQLPNSRQKWFCERLGIEALSRDIGSPNLFVTINLDPRASPDVRRLLYKLENGEDMDRDEPFVKDTAEFTKLINKFAPFVAVYLYRKVKAITRCFFTKICGIPEKETKEDWRQKDVTENSWYFGRIEYTETRGVSHWHFLVRLPFVLDTGLLGRIIHNGRVVRQEMKCGNIKPEKREQAWHMIEMSLLASRYAALFAHSISTASFYSEHVGIDDHEDDKVIRLEDSRKEFAENYKEGNINLKTHPIMRRFDDPECHDNPLHEEA